MVEFDKHLRLVAEYPSTSPADGGFNPHGIDADFSRNLLVTSDFINPVTTLNVFAGRRSSCGARSGSGIFANAESRARSSCPIRRGRWT